MISATRYRILAGSLCLGSDGHTLASRPGGWLSVPTRGPQLEKDRTANEVMGFNNEEFYNAGLRRRYCRARRHER
jgi:hypothetical protein